MAGWSWRILVCTAALGLIVAILIQLKFVVVPLLLALLISSVLVAADGDGSSKRGWSRGLASTLTVFVAIGVLVGFALLAMPPFMQATSTTSSTPSTTPATSSTPGCRARRSTSRTAADHSTSRQRSRRRSRQIKDWLIQGIKAAAPLIAQAIAMVGLTIVLTGYLLAGGDRYWQWVLGFFSPVNRPGINELGVSAYRKLATYLQATAQMAALYGAGSRSSRSSST